MLENILKLLGNDAKRLLEHRCCTVEKGDLHLPGPDFVERVMAQTDRPVNVLRNLQSVFSHGRLAGY
jgi:class I fructose-bisphosphate aldolase